MDQKVPLTRRQAIELARSKMRAAFFKLLEAEDVARRENLRIEEEWAHDPANLRAARKRDIYKSDADDVVRAQASIVNTMSAFIVAEVAAGSHMDRASVPISIHTTGV